MRHLVLYGLCVLSVSAMDTSHKVISSSCDNKIRDVMHDIPRLYCFLQGNFHNSAMRFPDEKPSYICSCIAQKARVQELEGLRHKTPYQYISLLLVPRYTQMDRAFERKARECGNRAQAWLWFADEYFHQNVLAPAASGYTRTLASADINFKKRRKH